MLARDLACVPILLIVSSGGILAQEPSAPTSTQQNEVQQAIEDFLEAFETLDWKAFRACFSDDATGFMPWVGAGRRVTGRAEVEAAFGGAFERIRSRTAGPRYLDINPKDLHIQMLADAAVVTFHLEGSAVLNRRTLIFQKRTNRWLIVHIHASVDRGPE